MRKTTLHKPSRRLAIRDSEFPDVPLRDRLKAPDTLGKPDDAAKMANDAAIASCCNLLGHSLDMGQMPSIASFVGYAALQDISQNGLVRACIETVADDMLREFGTATGTEEQVKVLNAELLRFNVQRTLHQVAEYVGYFGGCMVYIDTGADDAQRQLPLNVSNLSQELGKDRLAGFVVIDPINCYPGVYNSVDPLRKDFYKPDYWFVMGKKVHASRLIRFVANEVPMLLKPVYNFFGIAQAQILWDYVMHFNQCRKATADMATKYSMTVFKTAMTDTLFNSNGMEQIDKRIGLIARYKSNDAVIAIDKEAEDIVNVSSPMSGLTDIGRQALEFLASINRTPAVKLLGISPSGFNATGESDIRNYYDHIKSQREKLFRDAMQTILKCVQLNTWGLIDPQVEFEWDELGQEDEAAVATTQKTKADTLAVLLDRSVISQEEARSQLIADKDSGFDDLNPDDVPAPPEGDFEMPAVGVRDDVDKAGEIP